MNENDIFKNMFEKISNMEKMIEETNQKMSIILKQNEDTRNENIILITRFENLTEFIRDKFNIVIEETEEYNSEIIRR